VSINASGHGRSYSPELRSDGGFKNPVYVSHMDGARFAVTVAHGASPADLTWRRGVRALWLRQEWRDVGQKRRPSPVRHRTEIRIRRKRLGHLIRRPLSAQIHARYSTMTTG
jgi:hypothetical protein